MQAHKEEGQSPTRAQAHILVSLVCPPYVTLTRSVCPFAQATPKNWGRGQRGTLVHREPVTSEAGWRAVVP